MTFFGSSCGRDAAAAMRGGIMEKVGNGKEVFKMEIGGNMVRIRFNENGPPGVRENVRGILKQSHEERFSGHTNREQKNS